MASIDEYALGQQHHQQGAGSHQHMLYAGSGPLPLVRMLNKSTAVVLVLCVFVSVCCCRSQFKQGKSVQAVADALVEIAIKRYTTDNVAVIVADLKGTDAWKARPKGERKGLLAGLFSSKKD
jgi:hypothetical protein